MQIEERLCGDARERKRGNAREREGERGTRAGTRRNGEKDARQGGGDVEGG